MIQLDRENVISWIDRYLHDKRLKPEELLRKRWAWIWMVVTFAGVVITVFFFLLILNLWPLWWLGFSFIASYIIAFPLYKNAKRFDLVINSMFSLFIVLVFFALLQVGGIPNSLGFVFIGINCAMGSILVGKMKWTVGMFGLYCLSILLVGILQPYLTTPDYITSEINTITFVALTIWVNACILFLVILFMKDKSRLEKSEADKLRKIDEVKTQLYTNLSHEFRTPLTVINGISELLEKNPDQWLVNGPKKIKTQSNLLLLLINQMLDISKIEAGGMQLHFIQGNISDYIQFIASSFICVAENKRIQLEIHLPTEPIVADFDPKKLMHVMGNLLSNAIKFTPKEGTIRVSFGMDKETLMLSVLDTGKGISKEYLPHIFDRFYQVPDAMNETQGTGLGLALTQELVKLMKGRIEVKSTVGEGSEFIVYLPVSNEAPLLEKDHVIAQIETENLYATIPLHELDEEPNEGFKNTSEQPILLLVEDNVDVRDYLRELLCKHYSVVEASNGKLGFEKAVEIIPDIIITDIMMPQMDGFELIKKLRSEMSTDHIPVIVLTARGDFNSKLDGLELGADHYLTKPFNEKELLLKLNNLITAREKMQQKLGTLSPGKNKGHKYKQAASFLSKINALLEDELDNEDFEIQDVCNALNLSRPQLYRKFSALTNKSIGKYIKSYRLHQARRMMEAEGKNVTEAALDSGFKNLSHFSTSFHEEFGFPPSELLK